MLHRASLCKLLFFGPSSSGARYSTDMLPASVSGGASGGVMDREGRREPPDVPHRYHEAITRRSKLVLGTAAVGVLAFLAVFGVELSNTQASSRQSVENRVHDRAVLAAALIESLLQSAAQQAPQYAARYGTRVVSRVRLDAAQAGNAYVAVLDRSG